MIKFVVINMLLVVSFGLGVVEAEEANSIYQEFSISPTETARMGKWKNLSMDDLINDAINGDAAGLYMIGVCFLTGASGFTIDVEKANKFFANSASLGFAPSLRQISCMYLEEKKNPFLALVYLNLTISYGHPELVKAYHGVRAYILDNTNEQVVKEIEKIAAKKREQIEKNCEAAKLPENKPGNINIVPLIYNIVNLEDVTYGTDYWARVLEETQSEQTVKGQQSQDE
jgi:hypothetical protein